jgi:hypothetical protein
MKIWRSESGQTLVLTAMSLFVLFGFLGLATDVSVLFHDRRELQTAADGAAAAAALEQFDGGTNTQITAAAKAASSANGFTDGSNSVTVTVHTPPISGYHQSSEYVEVDVTEASIPTVFMGLFGFNSPSVSARAVGGAPSASKNCMWLGGTTGTDLAMQGAATINAADCGIYLNSSSSSALSITGGAAQITAEYVDTVSTSSLSLSGTPVATGVAPVSNPFGDTVTNGEPNPSTACTAANTTTAATFSGSEDASTTGGVWCFSAANVNISGANLSNGTFVFENGVTVGTGANTTISSGTVDVANGAFTQNSNSTFNVTAPKVVGQWNNGIALLVPTTNTTYTPTGSTQLQVQFGSNNQTFSGYIYAPNAQVYLQDHGGGITASGLIASSLFVKASTVSIPSYNALNPTTTPLRAVSLVE